MSIAIEQNREILFTFNFPVSYLLTQDKILEIQRVNPEWKLGLAANNRLVMQKVGSDVAEFASFTIRLPGLDYNEFCEFHDLNEEWNFEYLKEEEVVIYMGLIRLIGKLTGLIYNSFENWAKEKNIGEVYPDPTEYELEDPKKKGERKRLIPDVSFISYKTASLKIQNSWNKGFIPIPPNMSMEIVSAKKSLKNDLQKMQEYWMPTGVDVGIVVCPFSEKIYIFEKDHSGNITGPKKQSLNKEFSHPLLPGYSCNYGDILQKYKSL